MTVLPEAGSQTASGLAEFKNPRSTADHSEFAALRVVGTKRLTPHIRRITFAGRNLHCFATDEHLHVGLLLPPPGAPRKTWLNVQADGRASLWNESPRPVNRKYTIRAIDPSMEQIDIDFVLHEDGGPGGAWAARAETGDLVGILGPGGRGLSSADWYLIAGDETALPAIRRMMDAMPDDARGEVIIEVADSREEQQFRVPPGMTLSWLHRNGTIAGRSDLLQNAVRAVRLPHDGRPFVWVGAEFEAVQQIRGHFKSTGLAKADQLVVAYWRRGIAEPC